MSNGLKMLSGCVFGVKRHTMNDDAEGQKPLDYLVPEKPFYIQTVHKTMDQRDIDDK